MIEIKRTKQPTERTKTPLNGLEVQMPIRIAPDAEPALKWQKNPFTGKDNKRDYRAMYRAVYEYHERYNQKRDIQDYWGSAAKDLCEVSNRFDNDKFIMGLLAEVYAELEREHAQA